MKKYFDFKRIKRKLKYKSPIIGHYTEAEWNEIQTKNVVVKPTPKPKPAPVEPKKKVMRRPRIR
jgi:hypothetical protein